MIQRISKHIKSVLTTDNPDPSGALDEESATLKFARHSTYGDHLERTFDGICINSSALSAEEVVSIRAAQGRKQIFFDAQ